MAYQRPTGNGSQGSNQGQSKPQQGGGYNKPQSAAAPKQQQQQQAPKQQPSQPQGGGESTKPKGNKPKYRLAIVVDVGEGKFQTVKGEDGKTVYVGAAWENKFDGLNIKIEGDIPAGAQVRAYPVEDKVQS